MVSLTGINQHSDGNESQKTYLRTRYDHRSGSLQLMNVKEIEKNE